MLFGRIVTRFRKRIAAAVSQRPGGLRGYSEDAREDLLAGPVPAHSSACDPSAQVGLEGTGRAIEATAQAGLRESSELAEYPITCEFRDGTLMLRGRVTTYLLKQAAQSLVQRVGGVLAVDNRIDVIPLPVSTSPIGDPRTGPGKGCCRTS
jgi:osmotically-inducible protein OsmY